MCQFSLKYFICWNIVYFDSKYHILQWYFGQKCHFPSKIYYTCVMNKFAQIKQFFEKGFNLVLSNFRKNDNWF